MVLEVLESVRDLVGQDQYFRCVLRAGQPDLEGPVVSVSIALVLERGVVFVRHAHHIQQQCVIESLGTNCKATGRRRRASLLQNWENPIGDGLDEAFLFRNDLQSTEA